MLAAITHIQPLMNVRRVRLLPINGKVLVTTGQTVAATDVLATAHRFGKHVMLDLRAVLGTTRRSRLERQLGRKIGEEVQEGDIIASSGGLFRRELRAPADGVIAAITGGHILLEVTPGKYELKAGINGQVVELFPDRGAVVEADGTLVQGIWGNGKIGNGELRLAARDPSAELLHEHLQSSVRGATLLCGFCRDETVLQAFAEAGGRGLILGSLPAALVPAARHLSIPLIVLDGFGQIPVNAMAFELLGSNEKRLICLNAETWQPLMGKRPEAFIPLPADGNTFPDITTFEAGKTVRINSAPYCGRIGVIEALPGMATLPNRLRAMSVNVQFDNGDQILTPLANLDVIE